MRIATILTLILLVLNLNLNGQTRTIQGLIITEDFKELPKVRIQNIDSMLFGETDLTGFFKITVPQETDKLILSFIGMEETTIKLKQDCDTVEVVMIYNGTYDFMTSRKIDRLRFKRFKKLPELRKVAHEKGVFLNEYQCYEQDFVPIKPRLDRIKKDRKKLAPEISE
jgi:hypothetical protein